MRNVVFVVIHFAGDEAYIGYMDICFMDTGIGGSTETNHVWANRANFIEYCVLQCILLFSMFAWDRALPGGQWGQQSFTIFICVILS